jgi:hypothetical protein
MNSSIGPNPTFFGQQLVMSWMIKFWITNHLVSDTINKKWQIMLDSRTTRLRSWDFSSMLGLTNTSGTWDPIWFQWSFNGILPHNQGRFPPTFPCVYVYPLPGNVFDLTYSRGSPMQPFSRCILFTFHSSNLYFTSLSLLECRQTTLCCFYYHYLQPNENNPRCLNVASTKWENENLIIVMCKIVFVLF